MIGTKASQLASRRGLAGHRFRSAGHYSIATPLLVENACHPDGRVFQLTTFEGKLV
jgi:hypothetical protein